MKKVYSKPEILFEDFTVTANIATGCDEICNSGQDQCAFVFDDGFYIYFMFNVGVVEQCQVGPGGTSEEKYDSLCYHVPDGYNTFSS